MPLDTIGNYAASGSSGAIARNAVRVTNESQTSANYGFAGLSARGGDTGGEEQLLPATSSNLAVYISPFIRLDIASRLAIVEIRNSETGEVQQQYPSPRVVREYLQNLPDDSNLRAENTDGGSQQGQTQSPPVRIIGSAADKAEEAAKAPPVTFGQQGSSQAAPPAPSSAQASVAAAAFSSVQNTLTGAKQLAVA